VLLKLTLGVDFTNDLQAAFARTAPKSVKRTDDLTVFLRFWDLHCVNMIIELLNKNLFDKTTLGEELLSHGGDRDMSDPSSAFLMLSTIGGREKSFQD